MTSYIEIVDATAYFAERLNSDEWDNTSDDRRLKALYMATRIIDRFNYVGEKTDESQEHQFPRGGDVDVPDTIKEACCEIALKLLEDIDPDMEFENIPVLGHTFATVRNTYDRSFVPEHVAAGVPSPTAWKLLLPYLRDVRGISIVRAN